MRRRLGIALGSALVLTSCSGGDGGAPAIAFTAVTFSGTTSVPATVTIDGHADADGLHDTAFRVRLPLEEGAGGERDVSIVIAADDGSAVIPLTIATDQ